MPKRRAHTKRLCPKDGKVILKDWVAAELLLQHIQKNSRREIHTEKRSYPCEFGYGWHLTSEESRSDVKPLPHSA